MTLTDINSVIATVAAVGSFVYGALYYHRPRTPVATVSPQATPTTSRRSWIPLILAIVAWAAVALNWYILRGNQTILKLPISPDNARIDIIRYDPVLDEAVKALFVDFYIANHGKISAIGPQHQGILLGSNNKVPSLADYDAIFTFLKAEIAINKEVSTSEIQPGQTNISFRVPPAATHGGDPVNYSGYKNGDQYIYVMALIRYRDTTLEEHKYIYTESCIYFFAHAQYLCEGGHNQTYIQ